MQRIAILTYGSLITSPGPEIAALTAEVIAGVPTPMQIEYGRASRLRGGAPTLCPVERGGGRVAGTLLRLTATTPIQLALDCLYRREINAVGRLERVYDDARQRALHDGAVIDSYQVDGWHVLFAALPATLPQACDPTLSEAARATFLAERALASVTAETYATGRDGVAYLRDNLAAGIATPLSEPYKHAVLTLTGAATLDAAREVALRA